MDVTTFDARLAPQATDSMRNSFGASLGSTDESAFAEHLLPRTPSSRPSETADSSASATDEATESETAEDESAPLSDAATGEDTEARPSDGEVTAAPTEPQGTNKDDSSPDTEEVANAALAAASAAQPAKAPPPVEPTGAAATQPIVDPATAKADARQQAAKATDGATPAPQDIASAVTANSLTGSAHGDANEAVRSPVATNEPPADTSFSQTAASVTLAAVATPNVLETAAGQGADSSGATSESTEKPTTSAKTRTGKSGAKSSTAGTKGISGESAAGEQDGTTEKKSSDTSVSQPNSVADLLPVDTTNDHSPQNAATLAVGNDAEAARETQTRTQSLTERLPEQIFGKSSNPAAGSDELSSADQMRLIQRVARAIEVAPQNGGILRLRLRPPELGAVRLEVALQRGKMTARIETETTQARNVLLDQLPQLRERLEGQGIHIERFDVEVGPRDQGGSPSHSSHTEESYRSESRGNRPQPVEPETNTTVPSETKRMISATRVNVVI